jgi:hypothetical protein
VRQFLTANGGFEVFWRSMAIIGVFALAYDVVARFSYGLFERERRAPDGVHAAAPRPLARVRGRV